MPIPSGRPDNVLDAVEKGFSGRTVWPKAIANPEANYQRIAATFGYVAEVPAGFILTELGLRETRRSQRLK
jgi:hypothetical protein